MTTTTALFIIVLALIAATVICYFVEWWVTGERPRYHEGETKPLLIAAAVIVLPALAALAVFLLKGCQ